MTKPTIDDKLDDIYVFCENSKPDTDNPRKRYYCDEYLSDFRHTGKAEIKALLTEARIDELIKLDSFKVRVQWLEDLDKPEEEIKWVCVEDIAKYRNKRLAQLNKRLAHWAGDEPCITKENITKIVNEL